MAGGGDWTTTKLINIILLAVLLVLIIAGSITGKMGPLIDQVGAKFDETILKFKKAERNSEIYGDLEVSPEGICKYLNVGDSKNNYTLNYYDDADFKLNGQDVSKKVIDTDLDKLTEERELYYAVIEKLRNEGLLELMGEEKGLYSVSYNLAKWQSNTILYDTFIWQGDHLLYIYAPFNDRKDTFIIIDKKMDDILKQIDTNENAFTLRYTKNKETDFKNLENYYTLFAGVHPEDSLYGEHFKKLDQLSKVLSDTNINIIKEKFISTSRENHPTYNEFVTLKEELLLKGDLKMKNQEYTMRAPPILSIQANVLPYISDPLVSITKMEDYPKVQITNTKTDEDYAIQFTSNYIYFIDLILDKGYAREDLNEDNYLMYTYNTQTNDFEELANKEYILTDEAFEEMIEINKAYRYLKENCV